MSNAAIKKARPKYLNLTAPLLELDLVLDRYLQRHGSNISEVELVLLNELLDHADIDLWEIVSGCSERYDSRHAGLVARLRTS
jgi:succinate dehydrogenase flavin-adding protein (antitoxin of CptAB toxin-antitoxin module)